MDVNLKMIQDGGSFRLQDLERFTADVVCNKNYQIILSADSNTLPESIFLIIKTDVKVFVRDFFRDSREETNITLLTVSFRNQTTNKVVEINGANTAGLGYVVEGRGVVSLFGRMIEKTTRCQLHIGMLPTFYDSTRCKLCEKNSKVCGFCNSDMVANKTRRIREDSYETASDKLLGISIATYINDCLYWDDDAEVWTNDGCKVWISEIKYNMVSILYFFTANYDGISVFTYLYVIYFNVLLTIFIVPHLRSFSIR